MPILENQRHELFAQEIAKGKSANEAYVNAGYRPSRKNASRLRTKEDIAARVVELQGVAARSAEITIESICRELDEANAVAKERGQASAMVSASALRAKLAGLMVERVAVGGPGDFDGCESTADMADSMLAGPGGPIEQFCPVDEQDRQGLIELIERLSDEVDQFMSAIKERPHVRERCDLRRLTSSWQELELSPYVNAEVKRQHELRRVQLGHDAPRRITGNGNQRRITDGNGSGQKNRAP